MVYLLIAVIVAVALAPLLNVLPSRRQRSLAALRESAATAGLFVEFRDLPTPSARAATTARGERQVLYYGRRLPPAAEGVARQVWWRRDADWFSAPRAGTPPPRCMAGVPEQVLAFGVDTGSCGVYWREDGDDETVAAIASALGDWCIQLAA